MHFGQIDHVTELLADTRRRPPVSSQTLPSCSKRLRQTWNAVHRILAPKLWCRRSCASAPHRHTMCGRPTLAFLYDPSDVHLPGNCEAHDALKDDKEVVFRMRWRASSGNRLCAVTGEQQLWNLTEVPAFLIAFEDPYEVEAVVGPKLWGSVVASK